MTSNPMPEPLSIGVSTRALFDLETEHAVFVTDGVEAYERMQLEKEKEIIGKGCAFEVISRLLHLNEGLNSPCVEVVLLSRNSPNLSLRAFHSIDYYGLPIKTGSFTSGRSLAPYVPAWGIDLFLSNEAGDVHEALSAGTAAARLGRPPGQSIETQDDEVRIAFDGDAVLFSAESDEIFKSKGLQAFLEHEIGNATKAMNPGPLGNFLKKLSVLRQLHMKSAGVSKVRIAIVTARNAPAHERVVHTLRAWGTPADEAHFVGTHQKAPLLQAFGAHIFFDDQEKHVLGAEGIVAAGLVPGPHSPDNPVIPAG